MSHPLRTAGVADAPLIGSAAQLYDALAELTHRRARHAISLLDLHAEAGALCLRLDPPLIDAAVDGGPEMLAGELIELVDRLDRRALTHREFGDALSVRVAVYAPDFRPAP